MLWFVVSGALRFVVGALAVVGAVLLTGVLELDALAFAALGALAVYGASAFGIAPLLRRAAEDGRLRLFVGRGRGAATAFLVLAYAAFFGFIVGFLVFGLVLTDVRLWIGERGGAGAVYLTLSLALLVAVAASAVLRLLTAPLALWPRKRASVPESKPARIWESCEAGALLCGILLCAYGIGFGVLGADLAATRVDESAEPIRPGEPTRSLGSASVGAG